MPEYRFVGRHAGDVEGGRVLEPGDTATLSDEEAKSPHNQRLINSGILKQVQETMKTRPKSLTSKNDEEDA